MPPSLPELGCMASCGTFPELARWWRKKQRQGCTQWPRSGDGGLGGETTMEKPQSTNPRTLLLSVTRSDDGAAFIRGRVHSLRKELRRGDDPEARVLLALYLEKLGDAYLEDALKEMDSALSRMPTRGSNDCWARSERARLRKACDSLRARQQALLQVRGSGWSPPPSKNPVVHDDGMREKAGLKRRREVEAGGEQPGVGMDSNEMPSGCSPARFESLDERNASILSYEEFIETYALRGRPVILKGGASLCFEGGRAWDRESLRKAVGEKVVPVRRWVPDSVSWARLDDAGQAPFASLLGPPPPAVAAAATAAAAEGHEGEGEVKTGRKVDGGDGGDVTTRGSGGGGGAERGVAPAAANAAAKAVAAAKASVAAEAPTAAAEAPAPEPLYLHDWSLPQNLGSDCSLLADGFQVPKFFAGDMLQRVAGRGLPYTDSWPSLFVGPKGSKSDMHIDSFGSHFWMALLEGKKRWLLYPKEQAPLLHPVWPEGCHDPVFEADMETPDTVRTPAALLAKGFEGILEAGDLLFVPAGCPHRVENLTDTLALSCNYVDATNVDASLTALGHQALTDPGAAALASALAGCSRSLARLQNDVPWAALKIWPRANEIDDWLPRPADAGPVFQDGRNRGHSLCPEK